MAIINQPAEDSLYSAYSQIPVETDKLTPGLEIKTQNFDEDDMVSLNIIDNEAVEVIDNSGGSSNNYSVKFPLRRKVVLGEWYAFRVSSGAGVGATSLTVALFQATSSGNLTTVIAKTNIPIGAEMTWRVQIPPIVTTGSPCDMLVIFAGIEGATAGVKVTLSGMSLAYGKNFVDYSPSPIKAANSLTESINIYRDSGFGTIKKYDLSFLAKAGFRDDRWRTFPYIDQSIGFAINYSLISAYAYRVIGDQDFNVRYASRGVRARGYNNANFTESYLGLVLTDRVPDNDRNLYVKKYPGYPYYVTLFPRGFLGSPRIATSIDVRVKQYENVEQHFDISTRLNIPLVYEFEDADASEDEADYIKLRPSVGEYSSQAWNIIFVYTEVPCNPFYIRWINQKGGWDTYMFEQHKKYTQEVDRGDQYVLANSRDPHASQTRGELAPEFKNIVQAGAEQLDENDFNLLKGIALSPLVQRYNDSTGVWQRVLVDDTDLTWDTKTPRNTVSYEFQLIDEQTQW